MRWIPFQFVDKTGIFQEPIQLPAEYARRVQAGAAARGTRLETELAALLERGLRGRRQEAGKQ